MLSALLTAPRPDPARVLHHAVGAGDDEAVVRYGPAAAKQAADAGAYRQAAACCAEVLRRGHLLAPVRRAILTEAHAWALNNLNEQRASAERGRGGRPACGRRSVTSGDCRTGWSSCPASSGRPSVPPTRGRRPDGPSHSSRPTATARGTRSPG